MALGKEFKFRVVESSPIPEHKQIALRQLIKKVVLRKLQEVEEARTMKEAA